MAGNSLTYQYKTASIVTKLIVINGLIFLAVRLGAFFMQLPERQLVSWFVLPEESSEFITQPWAFITYGFLHFGFFHILFNMIWLYVFGKIVLNLFSEKRLLTVYLLGTIAGGILFALSYNTFPVFKNDYGYLIGASGAVTALMVFIATATPNTEMRLFVWNIKLWHIAVALILLDLVRLSTSSNAGGLLAHIGGAIFGFVYARQLAKGNDIGKWFENLTDWFSGLFKTRKQKPFKKVHRTPNKSAAAMGADKSAHQRKVDAILDKIGKSGYDSLTKAEKDFLFKAGKEN
jgi:membrane associated rhomboid family serine protease